MFPDLARVLKGRNWSNRMANDLEKEWAAKAPEISYKAWLERQLAEERERFNALYTDSMIAHRWFSQVFGEQMNGRDFAVKCPMANEQLATTLADIRREAYEECAKIADHYTYSKNAAEAIREKAKEL
jgi:hypothetical protein